MIEHRHLNPSRPVESLGTAALALTRSAALAAAVNKSSTPSRVFAEHSMNLYAPIWSATATPYDHGEAQEAIIPARGSELQSQRTCELDVLMTAGRSCMQRG